MSLKIFRTFIVRNAVNSALGLDASRIHSLQCFNAWLLKSSIGTKRGVPDVAYRRFYRALCNHVSGVDGRTPFSKHEEFAVLLVLRETKHWPCFPAHITLGESGFRALGHHEKQECKRKRLQLQYLNEEVAMQNAVRALMHNNCAEFTPQEFAYVNNLLAKFPMFVRSFNQGLTREVWHRCLSVLRLCSLTIGPATCIGQNTPHGYAQELCLRRETSGEFIAVYCILTGPRIAVCNALTIDYFSDDLLPHSADLAAVLFACFWVMLRPGNMYTLPRIRLYCSTGEYSIFNLNLWLDPEKYFFVCVSGHKL